MIKIRRNLTFYKAGRIVSVEIVGEQKSIDRLCRNLETDTGVEHYTVTDPAEVVGMN